MLVSALEAATNSLAFISFWICRVFLRLLRTRPVQIRYEPAGKHYPKKKLYVLNNSIYMVILVTVLLSSLEERRKVCQTFSRSELQ